MRYLLGNISKAVLLLWRKVSFSTLNQSGKTIWAIILVLALISFNSGFAQEITAFKMLHEADQKISTHQRFTSSTIIYPFEGVERIFGLSVSGKIKLFSDTSLVRIILLDEQYNEFLIYEVYPLLSGSFDLNMVEVCEETNMLDNIQPHSIHVELRNAICTIDELSLVTSGVYKGSEKLKSANVRNSAKLESIQKNLKAKNLHWNAGETSVSRLSYAEKKILFGGEVPNLNGFEYYTGGIFVVTDSKTESERKSFSEESSEYVDEFSWQNRHGIDWTTPAKNQGSCGSCWAFSTTGATEILANLFFNQKLDLDLSEQNLITSVAGSSCNGGYPGDAFRYIRSNGIVSESCMPYASNDNSELNPCNDPDERINISGIRYFSDKKEETLKQYVMNGPVSLGINSWKHTATLVGFKLLHEGDTIRNQSDGGSWVTIPEGDPLIGRTAWIIKNSWGSGWGDNGFAYLVLEMEDISSTYQIFGAVKSLNYGEADILCTDLDGDGYYFWGLGPKPSHCPPCPDAMDGDDSDPCTGPLDAFGHPMNSPVEAPKAVGAIQCENEASAILTAAGEEIKWYADKNNSQLLFKGNEFNPGVHAAGIHYFYATQTVGSCESLSDTAMLKVSAAPDPPLVWDTIICEGETFQHISALGENIRWYSTQEMKNELFEGKDLKLNFNNPGSYIYYATQEEDNCESLPAEAVVKVQPKPIIDLGEDQTIALDQSIELNTDMGFDSYLWSDGSTVSTLQIEGWELGLGSHMISLEVQDLNNCVSTDSINILVGNVLAYNQDKTDAAIRVYPNPSNGLISIKTQDMFDSRSMNIILLNSAGQQIRQGSLNNWQNGAGTNLDLTQLPAGVYTLVLGNKNSRQTERIVIQ